ncbi:hypothetical protein HB818_03790 [Listeria booriae]|uniref:Uncharacterized protein n=1 Tax=Listeria booriae TaxID=1552123 RepID=A0A841ZXS0_9LIST|nr:hypothetical protein [Listeria booriae]MBC1284886.1 hypothetical protein [Listeria booriae]MBC1565070.1 hypothetical protein [Listeria booriae]
MVLGLASLSQFILDYNFLSLEKEEDEKLATEISRLAFEGDFSSNVRYGDDSFIYILPSEKCKQGKEFTFIFYLNEKKRDLLYSGWSCT